MENSPLVEEKLTKDDVTVKWMWGDAALIPGLHGLAQINPFRWSRGSLEAIIKELEGYGEKGRPIRLILDGETTLEDKYHKFDCPGDAVIFLSNLETALTLVDEEGEDVIYGALRSESTKEGVEARKQGGNPWFGFMLKMLGAPTLAVTLRLATKNDTTRSWAKRNIFVTYSYAVRITKLPFTIAKSQQGDKSYNEVHSTWEEFFGGADASLVRFIQEASNLEKDRKTVVTCRKKEYKLIPELSSDFWAVYIRTSTTHKRAIIALRGGDNSIKERADDLLYHVGSPMRAFARNVDPEDVPLDGLPFEAIKELGEIRGCLVTIVAYSQGAIAALGASYQFATAKWLERIVLYNAATMFWPPWLVKLQEAWTLSGKKDHYPSTSSWVVGGDPLADGVKGSYNAPRVQGENKFLPSKASGFENHYLKHFIKENTADEENTSQDDEKSA